jgi:hypothetical protein
VRLPGDSGVVGEFPSLRDSERAELARRGIDPERSYQEMQAGIRDGSFNPNLRRAGSFHTRAVWPRWFTNGRGRVPYRLPLAAVLGT